LHGYDPNTPADETLGALDDLVHQGKVRYTGCSNFLTYQLVRAIGRSETLRLARFDSVQPRYNLLFRQIEREMLPFCEEEGVGVIPYNPIAGGLLSGKHSRTAPPLEGSRFTLGWAGQAYQERYWNDRAFDTVEVLRKLADQAGVSLVTLSVAWVLAGQAVTAPIIGASRPQADSSCTAAQQRDEDRVGAMPVRPQLGHERAGRAQVRHLRYRRGRVEDLDAAHRAGHGVHHVPGLGEQG
jgi:aryl-alcohol dehydrogenase-like predicted oxidoreductase